LSTATATSAAVTIAKKALTPTVTGVGKTYDGATAATYTTHYTVSFTGLVNSETLTYTTDFTVGSAAYASKDAGSRTVTASTIALTNSTKAANYSLSTATATSSAVTIAKKALTPTVTGVAGKTYDRATTATYTTNYTIGFTGLVIGETLAITSDFTVGSAAFSNANAGAGRTITASTIALTNSTKAANYSLSAATATGGSLEIAKKAITGITVNGIGKTYDGKTAAAYTTNYTLAFTGVISGDEFTYDTDFTVGSAAYASADAGSRTVAVSGVALKASAKSDNYTLSATTGTSASVAIAKKDLSYTVTANSGKVYDGSTTAPKGKYTINFAGLVADGDLTSLTETTNYTVVANYSSAAIGQRTITAVVTLTGTAATNYNLTTSSATSANQVMITNVETDFTVTAISGKTYDGTDTALSTAYSITFGDGNTYAGQYSLSAKYDSKNVGQRNIIVTITLNADAIFVVAETTVTSDTKVAIAQRIIAPTVTGKTKIYDGASAATYDTNYTVDFTGLVSGETLAYSTDFTVGSAAYASKDAGSRIVTASTIALTSSPTAAHYT
jgi:hypothetical protein